MGRVLDEVGLPEDGGGTGVRDEALLVTSEMLTNAVRACRSNLTLRIEVHRRWLKIEVSDDSPALAVKRQPGPEDTHGRGLDIIARLSTDWGQTTWNGSSKSVWSRLDLPPGPALALGCNEQ